MEQNKTGRFIAFLRKEAGITQKQLAERLNVSDKTVSHWERGESSPDISVVPVIADIFGVTCDELLNGERAVKVSDEMELPAQNSERENVLMLEKKLSKLHVIIVSFILAAFLGIPFGMFSGLLFKSESVGVIVFGLFIMISMAGIMISYSAYAITVRNNSEISKALAKEYSSKGIIISMSYFSYFMGIIFILISAIIIKYDIGYEVFEKYMLILYFIIYEIIFIMARASEFYVPKEKRKNVRKKVLLGAVVSVAMVLVTSLTAVYQYNCYEGNIWVDVQTARYTDFYEFKSFMEMEEMVYFDECSEEPYYLCDSNDNLIEVEWNNERVINFDVYDEEDEELCVYATFLPEGSRVNWNRITEFFYEAAFFVYPVTVILGLAAFSLGINWFKMKLDIIRNHDDK